MIHLMSWPLNELVKLTMFWTTGPRTALSPQLASLYTSEQCSNHLLTMACLSWVVVDQQTWFLVVVFVQVRSHILRIDTYPILLCFLQGFNPLVGGPVFFRSFCFITIRLFFKSFLQNISGDPWLFLHCSFPRICHWCTADLCSCHIPQTDKWCKFPNYCCLKCASHIQRMEPRAY